MPKKTIKQKNKLKAVKEGERKPKKFCEYCGEKLNLRYKIRDNKLDYRLLKLGFKKCKHCENWKKVKPS